MSYNQHGFQKNYKNNKTEWRRELGETEYPLVLAIGGDEALKNKDGRENLLINSIVYFTSPVDETSLNFSKDLIENAFKQAWIAIRLLYCPDIATTFEGKEKVYSSPSSPSELNEWADRTLNVDCLMTKEENGLENLVSKAVKDRRNIFEILPSCKVIIRQSKSRGIQGAIILYISHWRAEAGGSLMIINRLLENVVDLMNLGEESQICHDIEAYSFEDESEINLLTPCVEDALMGNKKESTQSSKDRVAERIERMAEKMTNDLQIAVTGDKKDPNLSPYKIQERIFSIPSTQRLIEKCKQFGISVTSAAHSAYLLALYNEYKRGNPSNQSEVTYASIMPAEVRSRMRKDQSILHDQGCWNSSLMLFLHLNLVDEEEEKKEIDFFSIAKSLKDQYKIANQKDWLFEDARQTSNQMNDFFTKLGKSETLFLKDSKDENFTKPYFTSLGILDEKIIKSNYKFKKQEDSTSFSINVQKISPWADSTVPGICMRIWTFDKKFNVQIASNQAWHKEEQIENLLNDFKSILEDRLKISIDYEEQTINSF